MLIDTGAERTIVAAKLVKPNDYLNKEIALTRYDGRVTCRPLAKLWLEFGEYVSLC